MRKGLFLVFEGPDKAGKSTQAVLLVNSLKERGLPVLHTREPGGTSFAEEIRKILLHPKHHVAPLAELLLYEAARAQHAQETLLPALHAGRTVVCERFTLATVVYQGYGRGLPVSMIRRLNHEASLGLKPDLTFLFDMPESEFVKRRRAGGRDRIEREKEDFRRRIRSGYRAEARHDRRITVLDARKNVETLQQNILQIVLRKIRGIKGQGS